MGPVSLLAQVVLVTDRCELVELLRGSARTHGAAQVRDDASRDRGMQMVTALAKNYAQGLWNRCSIVLKKKGHASGD